MQLQLLRPALHAAKHAAPYDAQPALCFARK